MSAFWSFFSSAIRPSFTRQRTDMFSLPEMLPRGVPVRTWSPSRQGRRSPPWKVENSDTVPAIGAATVVSFSAAEMLSNSFADTSARRRA